MTVNDLLIPYYRKTSLAGLYSPPLSKEQYFALGQFETYLNGAIRQWNRISDIRKIQLELRNKGAGLIKDDKIMNEKESQILAYGDLRFSSYCFLDIHYYLICFDKLRKLAEFLVSANPDLKTITLELLTRLNEARNARNFFEHYEERVKDDKAGYAIVDNSLDELPFIFSDTGILSNRIEIGKSYLEKIIEGYEQIVEYFTKKATDFTPNGKLA